MRTVCERTRSVRFLMTSRLRSLANEHSVELGLMSARDAALMFLRRLPHRIWRSFFVARFKEVWAEFSSDQKEQLGIHDCRPDRMQGKRVMLETVLAKNGISSPSNIMRVCSLMRDPAAVKG